MPALSETSSTPSRAVRRAALGLGVVALLAAGCSDDDDGGSDDATTESSEAATDEEASDGGAADADVTADPGDGDVWSLTAFEYRGDEGLRVAYECTADGTQVAVWGDGTYSDDSSVCTAAVHSGLIDLEDGGTVVIRVGGPQDEFEGSTANGITTSSYGSWDGSFTFPDA